MQALYHFRKFFTTDLEQLRTVMMSFLQEQPRYENTCMHEWMALTPVKLMPSPQDVWKHTNGVFPLPVFFHRFPDVVSYSSLKMVEESAFAKVDVELMAIPAGDKFVWVQYDLVRGASVQSHGKPFNDGKPLHEGKLSYGYTEDEGVTTRWYGMPLEMVRGWGIPPEEMCHTFGTPLGVTVRIPVTAELWECTTNSLPEGWAALARQRPSLRLK